MNRQDFHQEFTKLHDAFPSAYTSETVEGSWYEEFAKYGRGKIRYAFQQVRQNFIPTRQESFPSLARVRDFCKSASNQDIQYVMVLECCAASLPQHGRIRCGCRECQTEVFARWAKDYHKTYGRFPWEGESAGGWVVKAEELAQSPGGREGFEMLLKALGCPKTRGFEAAGQIVKRAVKNVPESAPALMEGHPEKVSG